jgi:ACS family hexuronate transporter-like MFS transporter
MVSSDIKYVSYVSRWAMLALLFFLQTSTSLVTTSFGPLAPFLQEAFNLSRAQVGLFTSMVFSGSIFLGVICGWLIDKFHVRLFLLVGPSMIGIFFIVLSQIHHFEIALLCTFLGGMGYVFVNPSAAKALTNWFQPESRATAIGIMKSGVTLGGAVGAAVLPGLALILGWKNALIIIAVTVIMLGAISITLYREPTVKASIEVSTTGLRELRKIITNSSILLLGGLSVVYSAIQLSASTYMVLFLTEAGHLPVVMAGTYLTLTALSGVAGRILWGFISDKVFSGQRKITQSLIGLITAIMAILIALFFDVVPFWLLYIMVAIFGLAAFGWPSVFITFLAELGGEERAATAVGFGTSMSSLGILIGPPTFGYIVDITHSYTMAWSIFGICTGVAAALMMLIRE